MPTVGKSVVASRTDINWHKVRAEYNDLSMPRTNPMMTSDQHLGYVGDNTSGIGGKINYETWSGWTTAHGFVGYVKMSPDGTRIFSACWYRPTSTFVDPFEIVLHSALLTETWNPTDGTWDQISTPYISQNQAGTADGDFHALQRIQGILFNSTGTQLNLLIEGSPEGSSVYAMTTVAYRFNLSTAWNVSTATFVDIVPFLFKIYGSMWEDNEHFDGFTFSGDGSSLIFMNHGMLTQVPLSVAYDISTVPQWDASRWLTSDTNWTYSLSLSEYDYYTFNKGYGDFTPDGTKFYKWDSDNTFGSPENQFTVWSLSTAWDLSTGTEIARFEVPTSSTGWGKGYLFKFNNSGTVALRVDATGVRRFTFSTPWDITNGVLDQSVTLAPWYGNDGVAFSHDGTKVYSFQTVQTTTQSKWVQFSCPSAFTVTGGTITQVNAWYGTDQVSEVLTQRELSGSDSTTSWHATGIDGRNIGELYFNWFEIPFFNSTGTKLYVPGYSCMNYIEYTLSTPWEISTTDFDNPNELDGFCWMSISESSQSTGLGIRMTPDGNSIYFKPEMSNWHSPSWTTAPAGYSDPLLKRRRDLVQIPLTTTDDFESCQSNFGTFASSVKTVSIANDGYVPTCGFSSDGVWFFYSLAGFNYPDWEASETENYWFLGKMSTPWDITTISPPKDIYWFNSSTPSKHTKLPHFAYFPTHFEATDGRETGFGIYTYDGGHTEYYPDGNLLFSDYIGEWTAWRISPEILERIWNGDRGHEGIFESGKKRPYQQINVRKLMANHALDWLGNSDPSYWYHSGSHNRPYTMYESDGKRYQGTSKIYGMNSDGTKLLFLWEGLLITLQLDLPYNVQDGAATVLGTFLLDKTKWTANSGYTYNRPTAAIDRDQKFNSSTGVMNPQGTRLYLILVDNQIVQINFATPWDAGTASVAGYFDLYKIIPRHSYPFSDISVRANGTSLYVALQPVRGSTLYGSTNFSYNDPNRGVMHWIEIPMTTPWEITTAQYGPNTGIAEYNIGAPGGGSNWSACTFSDSGNFFWAWSDTQIVRRQLSTRYDITSGFSTQSYTGPSGVFDGNYVRCIAFTSNGTKFTVLDWPNGVIKQWNLGSAHSLSGVNWSTPSATYSIPQYLTHVSNSRQMKAFAWSHDETVLYIPEWDSSGWQIRRYFSTAGAGSLSSLQSAGTVNQSGSLGVACNCLLYMNTEFRTSTTAKPGTGHMYRPYTGGSFRINDNWGEKIYVYGTTQTTADRAGVSANGNVFYGTLEDPDVAVPFQSSNISNNNGGVFSIVGSVGGTRSSPGTLLTSHGGLLYGVPGRQDTYTSNGGLWRIIAGDWNSSTFNQVTRTKDIVTIFPWQYFDGVNTIGSNISGDYSDVQRLNYILETYGILPGQNFDHNSTALTFETGAAISTAVTSNQNSNQSIFFNDQSNGPKINDWALVGGEAGNMRRMHEHFFQGGTPLPAQNQSLILRKGSFFDSDEGKTLSFLYREINAPTANYERVWWTYAWNEFGSEFPDSSSRYIESYCWVNNGRYLLAMIGPRQLDRGLVIHKIEPGT